VSLRSPLQRVRGLGSAKEGVGHWWLQRLTAVALVPLTLWFMFSLITLQSASYDQVRAWLAQPLASIATISLVLALFYHAQLGIQVVIEDYVHQRATEVTLQILTKFFCFFGAVACSLAILRISLGS
jgi:succinate dehydrogenase / fumarate reductase, membrane anchor subunit